MLTLSSLPFFAGGVGRTTWTIIAASTKRERTTVREKWPPAVASWPQLSSFPSLAPCQWFYKYFKTDCPFDWVERWDEQRANGIFPAKLD